MSSLTMTLVLHPRSQQASLALHLSDKQASQIGIAAEAWVVLYEG